MTAAGLVGYLDKGGEPQGINAFTREQLCGPARLRLYVATHTKVWVLDQDADVDQRLPVHP